MLPGIFIILLFYALGELAAYLTGGFIPGSVIGMVLLFAALCFKIVKAEHVKPVAQFLTTNLSLFFVPVGVGIVNSIGIISEQWQAILGGVTISTVLVIITVAVIQEQLEKRRRCKVIANAKIVNGDKTQPKEYK